MTNYVATVYSAPGCQKCRATERFLNKLGITVLHEQIHDTPEALQVMANNQWTALPLVKVEADGEETMYWCDLNTKNIDALKWLVNNG